MLMFVLLVCFLAIQSSAYRMGMPRSVPSVRCATSSSKLFTMIPRSNVEVARNSISNVGKMATLSLLALSPAALSPTAAFADVRAAQKRTYFRQIPKFQEGLTFAKTDLKEIVSKEDYAALAKIFVEYASKMNGSVKDQVDQTDTFVNSRYFRPMTIFAGSFAERGTSEKQRALMEQEAAVEEALRLLQGCTQDMKGDGFFAAKIKMPTGKERKEQLQKGYDMLKNALNMYVNIANKGLMLELNKLENI
jgi:hypothetical protein